MRCTKIGHNRAEQALRSLADINSGPEFGLGLSFDIIQ